MESAFLKLMSILLCCFSPSSGSNIIEVSPSCEGGSADYPASLNLSNGSDCRDLDTALSSLTSNTKIVILEGHHLVTEVCNVRGLANVTISGVKKGEVFVSCALDIGLSFAEIQSLTIVNVTISSCGQSGQTLDFLKTEVNKLFDLKIRINETNYCSVMVIGCREFTMEDVVVRESIGLGMLIVNAVGSLVLSSVTVSGSGNGGVYLLYTSYGTGSESHGSATHVYINDCIFLNNTVTPTPFLYIQSVGVQQSFIGGGLAVNLAQSTFSVHISIMQSTFDSNEAVYGGGMYLGAFTGLEQSSLHFTNCTFQRNCIGCTSNLGGGLYVVLGLPKTPTSSTQDSRMEIDINTSSFIGNQALDGGSLYLLILQPEISFGIQSSLFQENIGSRTSTIAMYRETLPYQQGRTLLATLKNCTIQNNFQAEADSVLATAMSVQNGWLFLNGSNHFLSNQGSGLTCINCQVHVKGDNVLAGNTGTRGGGLYLSNGKLVLYNGSELILNNNTATVAGGAVFVTEKTKDVLVADECFIIIDERSLFNCTFVGHTATDFHAHINLCGNNAPISSMIHGSSLSTCQWITYGETNFYQHLYSTCNNSKLFSFDDEPVGITKVSSQSVRLQITGPLRPMPGQEFEVFVYSLDIFNQSIPDVIILHPVIDGVRTRTGNSNNNIWSLDGVSPAKPLVINAAENASVEIEILSTSSPARNILTLQLATCYPGLHYDETEHSCKCDKRLSNIGPGIQCSIHQEVTSIPRGLWLGVGEGDLKNMLLWGHCPKYYCKESAGIVNITAQGFSFQCPEDSQRTGLLCGTCKENLSVVLSTSLICTECSNTSLLELAVILIIGVVMIFTLSFFHLSISEGYLNSMLFYCNVLSIYSAHFVPASEWKIIFIVADLLSLKLNFNICLYDGMTELVVVLIQYLFVLYIFILMGIAYKIASRYSLPGSPTNSPSKTAATLFVLCYMSLLDSCVQSLAFVHVYDLDGNLVTTRWRGDTSLPYFTSIHSLLVVLAVLVTLFVQLPFTVIVIFPRCPYKVSYLAKLKPVYDALWAPFRPETRWWLGLRLILRWVLFICAFTLDSQNSVFALGLILTCLLFVQSIVQPFAKVTGNRLDNSLIMLVLLLALGVNYANWKFPYSNDAFLLTHSIIVTTFFYSGLLMIFAINLHARFPNLLSSLKRCFVTLKGRCCTTTKEQHNLLEEEDVPEPTSTEVSIAGLREDSDLRQAEVVSTTGNPIADVMTMTNEDDDASPPGPTSDSRETTHRFDTAGSDRFYTCRNTDSQEPDIELH